MTRTFTAFSFAILCAGCTMPERNISATSIQVDGTSIGRKILVEVPLESAMERFEMVNRKGHQVSYVAFTDTDYGGLLFLDNKLYGSVSKHDAHAFYSCRGYTTALHYYWARDALDWVDSLEMVATPATSVTLNFSGKTAIQSIKEVASNQMLSNVKSLVGMGTNPFNILSTLNTTRSNVMERKNYERTLHALGDMTPGDSEEKLAKIMRPEDMSFTNDGMVMAYPSFLQDFYVSDGIVKVHQQPSLLQLSHLNASIFYAPNLHWERCNPRDWRQAMPSGGNDK